MLATNLSKNVFEVIQPGKGGQIEVLIAWHERILQTCHFPVGPKVSIGSKANINLPLGTMVRNFNLLESKNGQAYINLPFETKNYLQKDNEKTRLTVASYRLQQNEVVFISFGNDICLAVRFAPLTKTIELAPLLFSSAEYTAMLSALILTTLTSFIVSVFSPKPKKQEEVIERIVEVHFEPPPIKVVEIPVVEEIIKPPEFEEKIEEVVVKPEEIIKIAETPKPQKPKENKPKNNRVARPKSNAALVKTTDVNVAQSKSREEDPTKMGLMSVFSTDGIRKKMDLAYTGTGELMGVGERAEGVSGFNEDHSGDELGKRLKNTGEGGNGTATVGISKLKINREGLGKSANGTSFGEKQQTGITVGGGEETFNGTIDREAVRRAVKSHLPAIKNCYDREYKKNSSLEGKVVVAWEIHREGEARSARVIESQSTINNPIVEQCVRSVIETIRFPEPPDRAVVEVTGFPFVFSGAK